MLAFLKANVYNIIVIAIVLLVVFLIIRKIVKDKKAGKSVVYAVIAVNAGCKLQITKADLK